MLPRAILPLLGLLTFGGVPPGPIPDAPPERPNILLFIADDWGWPHAGAYGDSVVATPHFDRLAREGVLFENAFVSSPSCTPSRAALLTGQSFWRLGAGANLYGSLPPEHPVYTDVLEADGYVVGYARKGWAPGELGERPRNPAGPEFDSFESFLARRPDGQPFCFWFGTHDPHRVYDEGSGARSGIPLEKIRVPAIFPDTQEVREDVADYYLEVQRLDRDLGDILALLEKTGELDRTLIVVTSDNGMPFPRAKGNLYDAGVRVPMAIRGPGLSPAGRVVPDLVSLTDLAPTFLELAGLPTLTGMTGRSLLPLLASDPSGREEPFRTAVFFGRERHVPAQEAPDGGGYPMRAVRTADHLYITNFRPDRWPSGTPHFDKAHLYPAWYSDTDAGPTKHTMIDNRDADAASRQRYELAFGKRPAEELYDLAKDPDQLHNVAADPAYAQVKRALWNRLMDELQVTGDPRVYGQGEFFDMQPYSGGIVGVRNR